jgi:hypothetical protein
VLKPQELYRSRVQNLKVSEAGNPFSIGVRPLSRFLPQRYWSGWRFLVPPFFEDRGPLLSTAFPGGSCRIKSPTPYVMISDVPFAKRECRRRGRGAGYTPRRCVRSRDPGTRNGETTRRRGFGVRSFNASRAPLDSSAMHYEPASHSGPRGTFGCIRRFFCAWIAALPR